jgi:hypothetical protein
MARQLGARVATGSWLVFSDADVRFGPSYFAQLADADFAHAFYGSKHATNAHLDYSRFFATGQGVLDWLGVAAASGSNMGLRREVFEQAGGFRLDLPVNEDTELMLRLRHQGVEVSFIPGLAVYSLDDRRLDRGVIRKSLHSLGRNAALLCNLYVPLPKRLLTHDWGYWRSGHAGRAHLGDLPTRR